MLLTSPAPMCRRCLFAALVFLHSGGVLFAPQVLAPVMAGSVYLLLMLLKAVGLPVYTGAESGGWASPSPLGWVAIAVVWGLVWWLVAGLLARVICRKANIPVNENLKVK